MPFNNKRNEEDSLREDLLADLRERREKTARLLERIDNFIRELSGGEPVVKSSRFKGFTWLHEAISVVLHENGGKLTAQQILDLVAAGGGLDEVAEPSGAILKSLRANERYGKFTIERQGANRKDGDRVQLGDVVKIRQDDALNSRVS